MGNHNEIWLDMATWVATTALIIVNGILLHSACEKLRLFQICFMALEGFVVLVAGCFSCCLRFPPQDLRPHPATERKWWVIRSYAIAVFGVLACALSGVGFYLLNKSEMVHCMLRVSDKAENIVVLVDIAFSFFVHATQLGYVVCLAMDPLSGLSSQEKVVLAASAPKIRFRHESIHDESYQDSSSEERDYQERSRFLRSSE